ATRFPRRSDPPVSGSAAVENLDQPATGRRGDARLIASEAVVAAHLDDDAVIGGRWDPERVALTLDDERRHRDGVELVDATRRVPGAPRRPQRKRQAKDADGAGRGGGPARDARTRRPAARDQSQRRELTAAQMIDDGRPRTIELRSRRRRAATG